MKLYNNYKINGKLVGKYNIKKRKPHHKYGKKHHGGSNFKYHNHRCNYCGRKSRGNNYWNYIDNITKYNSCGNDKYNRYRRNHRKDYNKVYDNYRYNITKSIACT